MLKRHVSLTNPLLCDGEFFHIRCGAHVFNLIVHEGLKVIDDSVRKIRESVKYVRGSEGMKIKFAECIAQLSLKCKRQDVPTRWNSTYLMLKSALAYRLAFDQLKYVGLNFKTCPLEEEWSKIERIARFLKPFYEITTLFFGSLYPTSNLLFHGVWRIQMLILEEMRNRDDVIGCMATNMKVKFDKYWDCYSMVLSFAIVLEPCYKIQFVEYCFSKLDSTTFEEKVGLIRKKLNLVLEEYVHFSPSFTSTETCAWVGRNEGDSRDELDDFDAFESQRHYALHINKSQLDLYLDETRFDRKENLDVLCYWKTKSVLYPERASMALDILSIPITTVASEFAFSIGGQIIGKYRSSMLLPPSQKECPLFHFGLSQNKCPLSIYNK